MSEVNKLVLSKGKYLSQEKFESEIGKAIILLNNTGYIMTVKSDDPGSGIIVIEYSHADLEYGTRYPYWLSPKEEESVCWEE